MAFLTGEENLRIAKIDNSTNISNDTKMNITILCIGILSEIKDVAKKNIWIIVPMNVHHNNCCSKKSLSTNDTIFTFMLV